MDPLPRPRDRWDVMLFLILAQQTLEITVGGSKATGLRSLGDSVQLGTGLGQMGVWTVTNPESHTQCSK